MGLVCNTHKSIYRTDWSPLEDVLCSPCSRKFEVVEQVTMRIVVVYTDRVKDFHSTKLASATLVPVSAPLHYSSRMNCCSQADGGAQEDADTVHTARSTPCRFIACCQSSLDFFPHIRSPIYGRCLTYIWYCCKWLKSSWTRDLYNWPSNCSTTNLA